MAKNIIAYSDFRKIVREEVRRNLRILIETDNPENDNLDDSVIALKDAKAGKVPKMMIVKGDSENKKPIYITDPNTGMRKLNSGWTMVKKGLSDVKKAREDAQKLQSDANEGKGEEEKKITFRVAIDIFQ